MKKSIPVIISVVIGIVIGAGAMAIGHKNKAVVPSEVKSYKSFNNDAIGVGFTHTSDYSVVEKDPSANRHSIVMTLTGSASTTNSEGPTSITIDILKNGLGKKSLADWVKTSADSNFKMSSDGYVASTTIAGKPALTYTWDGLYKANTLVLARNNDVVMVTMTYITPADPIWKDFAVVLQTLQLK